MCTSMLRIAMRHGRCAGRSKPASQASCNWAAFTSVRLARTRCGRISSSSTGLTSLNHGALDVFLHPNTGDGLRDHRDAAVWIGHSHTLKLEVFGK
jgi:hypothetical protein